MTIHKTLPIALWACGAAFAQLESAIITGTTAPAAAKAGQTAEGTSSTMSRAGKALGAAGRRIVVIRARAHCGRQHARGERSRGEPERVGSEIRLQERRPQGRHDA